MPSSAPTASASPSASVALPEPRPRHEMPSEGPAVPTPLLGSACSAGSAGCGTAGRIAVERRHASSLAPVAAFSPTCTLAKTQGAGPTPFEARACVGDGRVHVSRLCVMCRLPGYETAVGVIAEMTASQAEEMQRAAGLPPSPALASDRAWRDAIAKAAAAPGGMP